MVAVWIVAVLVVAVLIVDVFVRYDFPRISREGRVFYIHELTTRDTAYAFFLFRIPILNLEVLAWHSRQ